MPKIIKKSGYDVRVLTSNGIYALKYKKRLEQVNEWNDYLDVDQKIRMEPSYLKVQKRLKAAAKKFGLKSQKHLDQLLDAVLSWSDDLEYRINISNIPPKLKKKYHSLYILSDWEVAKTDVEKLKMTIEVMSDFLLVYSEGNPSTSSFCDDLMADLRTALKDAEKNFTDMDQFSTSGHLLSSRDKAIYDLSLILSKNVGADEKTEPILQEISEIVDVVYQPNKKRSKDHDPVPAVRMALRRYEERRKKKIK